MKRLILAIVVLAVAAPAFAQIGAIRKGLETKKKIEGLKVTDEEAREIGASVSERIRQRYGVVQDPAVHKYVTLVGSVVAQEIAGDAKGFTFIVLDTDAVNAFAAPGGYVHITRGALGLIGNEAELAGVLGHEIAHVTEKHTIKAIEKSNRIQMTTETVAGDREVLAQVTNLTYEHIIENSFDRNDEMASDKAGTTAANKAGYAPTGLSSFLQRLADRNKGATEKRGLFASHPETKERIEKIRQMAGSKAGATAQARYAKNIKYEAAAVTTIAVVTEGSAGLTGSSKDSGKKDDKDAKKEEPKKGFGLGSLRRSTGSEQQTAQVSASGGSRGVGPDRAAKGGDNPAVVKVTVGAAEVAAFKKGIA